MKTLRGSFSSHMLVNITKKKIQNFLTATGLFAECFTKEAIDSFFRRAF